MKRKNMTSDQDAAFQERRANLKAISATIAAMSEDERLALVLKMGTIVTCEGRGLSPYNACMVIHQNAAITMIGGFHTEDRA